MKLCLSLSFRNIRTPVIDVILYKKKSCGAENKIHTQKLFSSLALNFDHNSFEHLTLFTISQSLMDNENYKVFCMEPNIKNNTYLKFQVDRRNQAIVYRYL